MIYTMTDDSQSWFDGTVYVTGKRGECLVVWHDGSDPVKFKPGVLFEGTKTGHVVVIDANDARPRRKIHHSPRRARGADTYRSGPSPMKYTQNEAIATVAKAQREATAAKSSVTAALVLDGVEGNTTTALLEAGFPGRIHVPNHHPRTATDLCKRFQPTPSVEVCYMSMATWVATRAASAPKLAIIVGDFCGMPGDPSKAESPICTLADLFRKGLVANRAYLTLTFCARSNVRQTKPTKYLNMIRAVRVLEKHASETGFKVSYDQEVSASPPLLQPFMVYTHTRGGSAMLHLRCRLQKQKM